MGRPRIYIVDENAFDLSNFDKDNYCYWLGFLLADGCVTGKYLTVTLAEKDVELLVGLRSFLGSTHPIRLRKASNSVRLEIHSVKLTDDLRLWGIVDRKSLIATVDPRLQNSLDFWRGLLDGDGYVATKTRIRTKNTSTWKAVEPTISLAGTHSVCTSFQTFIANYVASKCNVRKHKTANAHYLDVTGHAAATIHSLLYSRPGFKLRRKQQAISTLAVL